MIEISKFSLLSTRLILNYNDINLSYATGFFWRGLDGVYLITNWHVLSGRNSYNRSCMDTKYGAIPNRLYVDHFLVNSVVHRTHFKISGEGAFDWYEHPTHSHLIDVGALRLPQQIWSSVYCMNDQCRNWHTPNISDDVFILGYPLGVSLEFLPIWKRGTISTEPNIDIDNLPKLLVDTMGCKGMSGSPVIGRRLTGFSASPRERKNLLEHEFLGIYSGRTIFNESIDAQLGIIWKSKVIEEIVNGQKRYYY